MGSGASFLVFSPAPSLGAGLAVVKALPRALIQRSRSHPPCRSFRCLEGWALGPLFWCSARPQALVRALPLSKLCQGLFLLSPAQLAQPSPAQPSPAAQATQPRPAQALPKLCQRLFLTGFRGPVLGRRNAPFLVRFWPVWGRHAAAFPVLKPSLWGLALGPSKPSPAQVGLAKLCQRLFLTGFRRPILGSVFGPFVACLGWSCRCVSPF